MAKDKKIILKVPDDLHQAVKVETAKQKTDISKVTRGLLSAWLKGKAEPEPEKPAK